MQESIEEKVQTFGVTMTIGEYAIVPAFRFIKTHPDMDFSHPIWQHADPSHLSSRRNDRFAIVEGYFSGDHYETHLYKTEEYIAVSSVHHIFKTVHNLSTQHLNVS